MSTRRRLSARFACVVWAFALIGGCTGDEKIFDTEIVIQSVPASGAEVQINGQVYGVTPRTVRGLPPGPVLIDLTLEGYKRTYDTYEVPVQGAGSFTLMMPRLVGEVSIESTPSSASVYLEDGTPLGVTPLRNVQLPEGTHKIELRKDRYEPLTATLEVRADYKYTKPYKLEPRQSRIEVFSTPSSAFIYLNNRIQKEKTPARLPVTPGTYTVAVYAKGYIMAEQVITVEPASDANVSLSMKEGAVPPGMVLIPGGEFTMGMDEKSPDERPKRTLLVEAFYIDKYEVSNAQYKEVFPSHDVKKGQEDYPVTGLTWEQATEYAKLAGKRLPTEIEWEKAARGADGREYPWGNLWDPTLANINHGKPGNKLMPLGEFLGGASPYGCLDMSGNVYEWTSSWYSAYPGNTDIVKEYGQVYRVLRGGSYLKGPFEARSTARHYDLMANEREDYGLRCATDVAADSEGNAVK
ncbi:MAG: SUMF1/EgtB/PvdO family nonheme iron enzyme [Candidatus Hydrogenedentes bacterium]|nr:SUMF1/EgtB/PvdO family nonheme iron enzyme [Candidatus Hydrogenedentota bacterium]